MSSGSARTGTGEVRAFSFFVKVIHAYQRSPRRFAIPAHLRARAAALIPWHTEADLYRSDLRDRLPHGLTIPRALAVRDLGQDSAALRLEHLPARRVVWDLRRHARAAYLLGRLAASRAVAPLATAVHGARTPRVYADAWLTHVVLPALTEDGAWAHPLVRDVFDARLRRRLLAAADALPALLDELDDAPAATAHGDACTANLLVAGDRDALVMVDLGFCGQARLGTDLGQLFLGEVQTGQRHPADRAGQRQAHRAPVHVTVLGQLPDRQPADPPVTSDLLEQLPPRPRHPRPPHRRYRRGKSHPGGPEFATARCPHQAARSPPRWSQNS